ncbi:MAG: HAD-IB family phosphatase [Candidatus Bathyarchaeota archaeon]|nr:HAD-IB family phosphatase [Candidatus Bathyarchaeota archaeon]
MTGATILDMDGTLLVKRSIDVFCEAFGLTEELKDIDKLSKSLSAYKITERIVELLKGKSRQEMIDIFNSIPLNPGVENFVDFIRKKNFLIAIATDSYQFLAEILAKKLGIETVYGNIIEFKNDLITGKVLTERHCLEISECKEYAICKLWFLREIRSLTRGIIICVGDGDSDYCAFTEADIAIAYRPRSNRLKTISHITVADFDKALKYIKKRI